MTQKKLFTLIYGDSVHIAPKTKKLDAADFSRLLTSEQMLEQVKKDAERYRIDVTKECEGIKEQAKQEGFEAGYKEWTEHLARLEKEISGVRAEFEKVLARAAVEGAKKIVGRELKTSEDTIVDIVSRTLKAVAQHKKVIIYANKQDMDALEKNRPRLLQNFEAVEALSIQRRDDIQQGDYIIETEGGIINARLDAQWDILEKAFSTMFRGKTTTQPVER